MLLTIVTNYCDIQIEIVLLHVHIVHVIILILLLLVITYVICWYIKFIEQYAIRFIL